MSFPFSTYQLAFFAVLDKGGDSILVDAVAGSGKTTTIVEGCNRLPEYLTVMFLAFNKKIVVELSERLPGGVKCATFNSAGWRAWIKFTGKSFRAIKLDAKKTWRIIWDCFDKEDQIIYGSFVNKMVGLAKSFGLTPDSSDDEWWAIQDVHNVTMNSQEADYSRGIFLAQKTLVESIKRAEWICDFDDQMYMPWLRNASFPKFDRVFIDEVQDTNPVQVALLKRMLRPGGKLIAVGDPDQAIYGFRGADHTAMNNVEKAFNCVRVPLSISYRCGKSIVAEAQKYVDAIEASETAPDGQVVNLDRYKIEDFRASDAILCRNNAPLIEVAYQIISRGRGVNFLGRDIGAGLKLMIKNMEARDLDDLDLKLDAWLEKESEKLRKKKQEEKIELLEDRKRCIDIFIANLPQSRQTIGDLILAIDELFKSKGRGITLASVHKSKGAEWDRVFILDFNKYMPSKYAKKDWMKTQENNLIYVAITRAKTYLGYMTSNGWTDEPNLTISDRPRSAQKVRLPSKTKTQREAFTSFNPFDN